MVVAANDRKPRQKVEHLINRAFSVGCFVGVSSMIFPDAAIFFKTLEDKLGDIPLVWMIAATEKSDLKLFSGHANGTI